MNKLLVIGGSGMLGSSLVNACKVKTIEFDSPSSKILDIRNIKLLRDYILKRKPFAVINCAAWTDVEESESQYQNAYRLNVEAVKNIATVAKESGIPVVHISTDYVFNGQKTFPYTEKDLPAPINAYGLSKYEGEMMLLELFPENSYIVRTSWLYGINGKNFVKKILARAILKEKVQVVNDQFGSPTNSEDLAEGILRLVESYPEPGIYHFSNSGNVSWFEFAVKIYELARTEKQLVIPIGSDSLVSKLKRPKYSVFSTEKWENAGMTKIINWEKSLTDVFPRIETSVRKEISN